MDVHGARIGQRGTGRRIGKVDVMKPRWTGLYEMNALGWMGDDDGIEYTVLSTKGVLEGG